MRREWGVVGKLSVIDNWHQTKTGLITFGLLELAISYFFASLAVDTGSLWAYALSLVFLAGALQNAVRLIRTFISGHRH